MTCTVILKRMLEADLDELAGEGDSAVAVHVRGCARCRAVASEIVADTQRMAAALVPSRASGARNQLRRRHRVAYVGAIVVGGMVAATMLFVLVSRHEQGRGESHLAEIESPSFIGVSPTDGSRAAVIYTKDPTITVIWFYR